MLRRLIVASAIGLLLAIILRAFLIDTFVIPSGSMEPTLLPGDHIIVSKLKGRDVQRNDVVVIREFSDLEDSKLKTPYIKRIVAVPGDLVEVRDGRTLVNGLPVEGSAVSGAGAFSNFGPIKLPPQEFFLVGDNHRNSRDSRFFGPVKKEEFIGRAMVIFWSRDMERNFPLGIRWRRFGLMIQ